MIPLPSLLISPASSSLFKLICKDHAESSHSWFPAEISERKINELLCYPKRPLPQTLCLHVIKRMTEPPDGMLATSPIATIQITPDKRGSTECSNTHPKLFEIPKDRCFMNTRHYYYLLHCSLSWRSLHRSNICSLSAPSQMYFYFCKLLPINFLLIFLVIPGLFI